jgi:L-ascorbate metabolism protein UlaG (beta-lactamase superfamily)
MPDLAKYLDVLVITHIHGDHFDRSVIDKAVENNVKVVVPDEKVRIEGIMLPNNLAKDSKGIGMLDALKKVYGIETGNLISLKSGGTIRIKDVDVTAFSSVHKNPGGGADDEYVNTPVDWFYVNVSGFTILHTGDGFIYDDVAYFKEKPVDLFLLHYVDGRTMEDFYKLVPNARTMVPLHLHEIGHGKSILEYAMFKNAVEQFSNGYLNLSHLQPNTQTQVRYTPMVWGESIELSHTY